LTFFPLPLKYLGGNGNSLYFQTQYRQLREPKLINSQIKLL
jgi:hypothetical protein